MEHANSLDLADFENATYYDQLQQAQSESQRRPVQMVSQVFGLIRSIITFGSMIALLASLSWWIARADPALADPGLHLRFPLRLVGVPDDAPAIAGAPRDVLPHDPDDDR